MNEHSAETVFRFAICFSIIVLLFGVVVWHIIRIQYVERDEWEKIAESQVTTDLPIRAARGNIYDCHHRLLASDIPQYSIHMDTRVEALHQHNGALFYQYLDSMACGISQIIGDTSAAAYRQKMLVAYRAHRTRDRDIRLCSDLISYPQKKAIEQLPLIRKGSFSSGIYFRERYRRVKPFGSLGSRTIGGIYGEDGVGNAGLEMRYNTQLTGQDGTCTHKRVAGKWRNVPVRQAVSGQDIVTTLDADLMDICESRLRERLLITQADWGCVILMEVQSGEVKAICNLDRGRDGEYYETTNHAVTRVEPGSTFKTISLMAAMEDSRLSLDDTVRVYKDCWQYYDAKHTDSHSRDTLYHVIDAMAVSSNQALAQIIVEAYDGSAKKMVRRLDKMGLKDSIDYCIPGAQQAVMTAPDDTVTISRMAYGYSVELSPMQSTVFYNAIANNGKMVAPMLVREIHRGDKVKRFKTTTIREHICSASTLRDIRQCLHAVVWDNRLGTASVNKSGVKKAQSDKVSIAGKTGTAQLIRNGQYSNTHHRISFVGYFPEDHPIYTCMCVMENPHNAYDSGMDCGSVVRKIAEQAVVYAGEQVIQDGILIFQPKQYIK